MSAHICLLHFCLLHDMIEQFLLFIHILRTPRVSLTIHILWLFLFCYHLIFWETLTLSLSSKNYIRFLLLCSNLSKCWFVADSYGGNMASQENNQRINLVRDYWRYGHGCLTIKVITCWQERVYIVYIIETPRI